MGPMGKNRILLHPSTKSAGQRKFLGVDFEALRLTNPEP